ncbi:MAG TPA: family 78 glycoside hydrolase catalytic domain [Polyangiaceae bacterium]|nr:family 78 glycoside hydrolase catalytic domain [Polyangiaceae bacterium]
MSRLRWNASERAAGVLALEPRLEWLVSGAQRGGRQTAYQVLVANDPSKLTPGNADIWDSGKVAVSDSINVRYAGPALVPRQRGVWTVRVWDEHDRPSTFAAPATWDVGPDDEAVEGHWIGRAKRPGESREATARLVAYVRKSFPVPKGVREARLYATAFGSYEISINGRRVGDDVLAPGYTDYDKRLLMQTRDVTSSLQSGENVIGGVVAGGWCTLGQGRATGRCGSEPPHVRITLEITYSDGQKHTLESDESWKYHDGPLLSAELYAGESYDARRETPGWDAPGFDDRDWLPVSEYETATERNVYTDPGVPMRVAEDVTPHAVTEPRKGVFVFDLGRPIVGWASIALSAAPGTEVSLRYAEELGPDGTLGERTRAPEDRYVAKGSGVETWQPRFSLRSFRYVEVQGLATRSALSALIGRVVHAEMPETGRLETSSPLVNQLFSRIGSLQKAAFLSVPSHASKLGEGSGALLDAQAFAFTSCLNHDVRRFYRKWIDDIRDAQLVSAAYAMRAPSEEAAPAGASAASAGILVPWALYRCYADHPTVDLHVTSMGRFLDFVKAKNPDLVWRKELGKTAGDPLEGGDVTDPALLATAELSYAAGALAHMMRAAGGNLTALAESYEKLSEGARVAFNREFVLPDGRLRSDTQTAYAVAIERGVFVGAARDRAGEHLAAAVERAGRKPTTGLLATGMLLPALSKVGRDDLAHALLAHFAEQSAAQSLGQLAFGAIGEWMYDAIAGIALDPLAPAGRHVLVRPRPGGGLTSARAAYESLYGRIETTWSLSNDHFRLKTVIPPGSRATVTLPVSGTVSEGRAPVEKAAGVRVVASTPAQTTLELESGSYDFDVARR